MPRSSRRRPGLAVPRAARLRAELCVVTTGLDDGAVAAELIAGMRIAVGQGAQLFVLALRESQRAAASARIGSRRVSGGPSTKRAVDVRGRRASAPTWASQATPASRRPDGAEDHQGDGRSVRIW